MWSLVREYLAASSLHGARFLIVQEDGARHWSERIFWAVCVIFCWIGSVVLMMASWDDFQHNSISFGVDTTYLQWDTKAPSIAACEYDNQKRIAEVTDKLYGDPHDYNLDEIVKELVYFRGLSYYTIQLCGDGRKKNGSVEKPLNPNCLSGNFSYYSDMVRIEMAMIIRMI